MISSRSFLAKVLTGLALPLAATQAPQALAQGGFGADPYRPYNNQYDAFVFPIAPGEGGVVPSEGAMSRAGMARANRFQDYMNGVTNSDYRTQRRLDPRSESSAQYRPNRKVDEESGYNKKQEMVSEAYFAYIREKDPRKRAELLKDYQKIQAKPIKEFALEAKRKAARTDAGLAGDKPPPPRLKRGASDSSSGSPSRSGTGLKGTDTKAPASGPAAPTFGLGGIGAPKPSSSRPSDILEESMKLDKPKGTSGTSSRAGSAPPIRSRSSGRNIPPPPRRSSSSAPSGN